MADVTVAYRHIEHSTYFLQETYSLECNFVVTLTGTFLSKNRKMEFKYNKSYLKCSGLPIIDLHSTHFKSSPSGPSEYFRPRSSRTLDDTGAFRDFGWLAFGFAVSNSFIITCSWFGVVVDKLALLAKII